MEGHGWMSTILHLYVNLFEVYRYEFVLQIDCHPLLLCML